MHKAVWLIFDVIVKSFYCIGWVLVFYHTFLGGGYTNIIQNILPILEKDWIPAVAYMSFVAHSVFGIIQRNIDGGRKASHLHTKVASVAASMIRQRQIRSTFAVALVLVFFLAVSSDMFPFLNVGRTSGAVNLLAAVFVGGLLADNMLVVHRIRKGSFGNNENEARELVAFILKNTDKFDPHGGPPKIFDPVDIKRIIASSYGEAEAGAHARSL